MEISMKIYNQLKQKVNFLYKKLKISKYEKSKGRKLKLSVTEIITLGLYKHKQTIETKKALYETFKMKCSYKTLVVNLNRFYLLSLLILLNLMRMERRVSHPIKHTDSTDIPVCLNKNAERHKTMKALSSWGHSGKGLYYGLKLHLTSDLNRNILSISFTQGGKDDRSQFMKLNREMEGVFIADAGYTSKKLQEEFYIENKRILIAKPRKNMKKLASAIETKLYDTRMIIELNFRNLKMFYGLVTSLPRSIDGYLANYVYSILSYILA